MHDGDERHVLGQDGQAREQRGQCTFTVTGVAKAGTTYAAASNHEPDTGDTSTGTSITVNRPT